LVWFCNITPPVQEAGHDRVKVFPEMLDVIDGRGWADVTTTDPSLAKLLLTVQPGEMIGMEAPPGTA
jgi:hypothetical protein